MKTFGAIACLALLVALAGCADRSSPQDDNDKLCEKLAVMDASATKLASLDQNTVTVAQVRDLKAKLDAQYKDVQAAAKDVSAFQTDAVTKAYNDITKSVAPVNSKDAYVSALPQINQAVGELSDARLQVNTSAGC